MKGVVLQRSPSVTLVDICHGVTPFSILEGAYTIAQAVPYFPDGTVHVVVVDPGVGSVRKALVAQVGSQYFVAPDNGVLSSVFEKTKPTSVYELQNSSWFNSEVSATFHGRDIFAAAAGHIVAGGAVLSEAGPPIDAPVVLPKISAIRCDRLRWQGSILSVDHFGNLITNFAGQHWPEMTAQFAELRIGSHRIRTWQRTFSEAAGQECFAYLGSSGYLEVGSNQRRASDLLQTSVGDELYLVLHGGLAAEQSD